jgi:trans-2,3-dihydro-3-hydroxyanthranilate isomerase
VRYHHVDVFSSAPYSGNSLAVFSNASPLNAAQMKQITKELRHFESIFLTQQGANGRTWGARVFDLFDELDFAGHPVIGAACVLHASHGSNSSESWTLRLKARTVQVTTQRRGPGRYAGVLDQGPASFLGRVDPTQVASWFSMSPDDLDPALPPEVVSTGLRYLVLPVRGDALARARIASDLESRMAGIGAQFAYLLDAAALEGRHWNNDGVVEDVATGSGAGCAAAYLRRHGRMGDGEPATLRQGRFTGRPSEMTVIAHGAGEAIRSVEVAGDVVLVAEGRLLELPE